MAELCLMASRGYPSGLLFHPAEYFPGRLSKDSQPFLPNFGFNQDSQKLCSFDQRMHQIEEPFKPKNWMFEDNEFFRAHSNMRRPLLIDVQDFPPKLILRFGTAKPYASHERALRFLLSRSSDVERGGIDLSKLFDIMGPQAVVMHMPQQPLPHYYQQPFLDTESQPSLISPIRDFFSETPLFVGDLGHGYLTYLLEGQLSVTSSWTEMKDILGTLSEVYSSNNAINWKKQQMLVPYFNRRISKAAKSNSHGSSSKVEPVKSSAKVKCRTSPKKKSNMKASKERDLYRNNYLHACESLLSIMVDNKRHGRTAIHSLKRSGPEIPKLLTQFSASIAGTGLAVVFSVVCKVACSRAPFCGTKLFSTGLGLGLVWLSWAVNKLRDTVISINKNSGKLGVGDEEMMSNLDRNVREIYFRVVTIMVVAVLRFA